MKRIIFRTALFVSLLSGLGCGPLNSTITPKIVKPDNFDPSLYIDADLQEVKSSDDYLIPDTREAIIVAMRNFRYPEQARVNKKGGRVVLKIYLDENGIIDYIESIKPIGYGMDEEAISAISKANFSPGQYRGQNVKMAVYVPILFNYYQQE